jgi:hypothetical protein
MQRERKLIDSAAHLTQDAIKRRQNRDIDPWIRSKRKKEKIWKISQQHDAFVHTSRLSTSICPRDILNGVLDLLMQKETSSPDDNLINLTAAARRLSMTQKHALFSPNFPFCGVCWYVFDSKSPDISPPVFCSCVCGIIRCWSDRRIIPTSRGIARQ